MLVQRRVMTRWHAHALTPIDSVVLTADVAACACAQTRFVGMMQYDGDLKLPARFLVPPPAISDVSGELLAKMGVSTFACSETQKFGHVRTHPSASYLLVQN